MTHDEAAFWFFGVMAGILIFFVIAFGGDDMDGYD